MARLSKAEKAAREAERLDQMWIYEREAQKEGYGAIAGLDEAGRGPWAGPVSAAAVILPPDFYLEGVNDSKKLSAKKREQLAAEIRRRALDWSVVLVSPQKIDELNILEATRSAMTQAIQTLSVQPDCLLLDAVTLPGVSGVRQVPIIKGDAKSISIACASILAKVTRDQAMDAYDSLYPGYGLARHKGYGTKQHQEALAAQGVSPIHRFSYRPVREIAERQGKIHAE